MSEISRVILDIRKNLIKIKRDVRKLLDVKKAWWFTGESGRDFAAIDSGEIFVDENGEAYGALMLGGNIRVGIYDLRLDKYRSDFEPPFTVVLRGPGEKPSIDESDIPPYLEGGKLIVRRDGHVELDTSNFGLCIIEPHNGVDVSIE